MPPQALHKWSMRTINSISKIGFWNPYDGPAEYVDALCIVSDTNIDFSEEYEGPHFAADMDYCRKIRGQD